jgi:regulator of nonsense transcripts 2
LQASELADLLIAQFRLDLKKKNPLRIESKIRCIRFIAELVHSPLHSRILVEVKFGVMVRAEALSCLRLLLFDFRHHNIDMACALLDSAGLFLYRNPDSHVKTRLLLDVMMRKRQRIADPRSQACNALCMRVLSHARC